MTDISGEYTGSFGRPAAMSGHGSERRCSWCGICFKPRHGGSPRRFCSARHRTEFHAAARRLAERAVAAGILTIADLRNGAGEACTLPLREEPPIDTGPPDPAFLAALRRRGTMFLRLPVSPEGIADLVALNWLDRRNCGYPASVADAVIDLATEALDARLQPRWS